MKRLLDWLNKRAPWYVTLLVYGAALGCLVKGWLSL